MTPSEAAALLTVCAAFDNRKPDPDAAKAWAMALDGLRFHDCRDAIVAHYRKSREWIMPSEVIATVKAIRKHRLDAFGPILPPAELADDPAAEARWLGDKRRQIADGEIERPEQIDTRGELRQRDVASLGQIGRPAPDA